MSFFQRELSASAFGCVFDIVFFLLSCCFPVLFIFYIPYCFYSGYKWIKKNRMYNRMNDFLESKLSGMTKSEIEAKRIEQIMILQSPFSTQAEKDVAEYTIKYIEKYYADHMMY